MAISPITTKLEAVNLLLSMVGETPVNSLENSQLESANIAMSEIDRQTRFILAEGLNFNTDEAYPFTPDVDSMIACPEDMIAFNPVDRTRNIVIRSGFLYDKDNKTNKFEKELEADVTWAFPFDECPEHVKQYIAIVAGRVFQVNRLGSDLLWSLTERDEYKARSRMQTIEEVNTEYNMLDNMNTRRY